jgi:hypothetical protein
MMILKWLKGNNTRYARRFQGEFPLTGSREHDNEFSGSIKSVYFKCS